MRSRISTVPSRRHGARLLVWCAAFVLFLVGGISFVHAQAVPSAGIVLVPGTVTLGDDVDNAIVAALERAAALFPNTTYFAVTDWRRSGNWAVASVIGLSQIRSGNTWSADDGTWVGIVLLEQSRNGAWHAATQGAKGFSSLLAAAPSTFLDASAKANLDPLRPSGMQTQATSGYIFPLEPGTLMFYGNLGIHPNGFTSVVSGWKAVDMMSDGDTSQNHAPNSLIASETGTISYVCKGSVNVAVKMGDFFYTHLVNNSNLFVGKTFNQGDVMGKLKTGTFKDSCGYADQPSNWFHVHWGFPNADLQVGDWTLSMSTGNWTDGTTTVTPGNWFLPSPIPPMPANLVETGATQNSINFAWNASSGADGYHVYSWNGSNYALLDTIPSTQITYTEIRSACGWSESYKVSAFNSSGDSSRAGPLQASTIPCDASPASPANASTHPWNFDLTFQSSSATGATGYLMEYWGGPYTSPQQCGWSTTPSCHVGVLPPDNIYSWHVKAKSSGGETGWSPTWTFTIQPLPCYTLTVGHAGSGADPVASPASSSGCGDGQYHPGDTISFSSAPNTGWTVGSWTGTDNDSSTATSNTLTMPDSDNISTVIYTPIVPGVPVLVSPLNGATRQPVLLTLVWNAASGAISYDYCISTTTICTTWVSTGTNTSVALPQLSYGTLYYWWVQATNVYGNSSVSSRWHFTTGSLPGYFTKMAPANAAIGQPPNVLLRWGGSSGAAEYQYCIDTVDDDLCQGDKWISTGMTRNADLTGHLAAQTTYYWQVRAVNSFGTRYAKGGWWSFTTASVPGSFLKKAPANSAVNTPLRPTLSWGASQFATGYEYCVDQTNDGACAGGQWFTLGVQTSIKLPSDLLPLTAYYWQVRAVNGFGATSADGSVWRSFTTGNPPAAFGKTAPGTSAQNQPLRLALSWQPSVGATGYQYCLSTMSGDCSSWISTGIATSVSVRGLSAHTTYYWQVQASNSIGATGANAGTWWSFTTGYLPAAFAKATPAKSAANIAVSPILSWNASTYATSYEYCLSTSTYCSPWVSVGNQTSANITGLKPGTVYYWHVRARNNMGLTSATGGLWSFRTGYLPSAFGKSTPANSTKNQPVGLTLTWAASAGATSYDYCIDNVNDGNCQNQAWTSAGSQRSADLTGLGLMPNTTYYWQVRAVNPFGIRLANAGAWWKFTTAP